MESYGVQISLVDELKKPGVYVYYNKGCINFLIVKERNFSALMKAHPKMLKLAWYIG